MSSHLVMISGQVHKAYMPAMHKAYMPAMHKAYMPAMHKAYNSL
jgi:hypothetical protein